MDTGGKAIAVWQQSDGTRDNIWSNRYIPGSGWDAAELIETDNAGNADNPQVAINSNGSAVAVWSQSDGTRFNIWSNRYESGSGWGTAELIETDNVGNAEEPQVAMDNFSNAMAVWSQSDGTRNNIWSNLNISGSGWGTPELIETYNAGDAFKQQAAINSTGNVIAVWQQYDGIRYNIWSNRYVNE